MSLEVAVLSWNELKAVWTLLVEPKLIELFKVDIRERQKIFQPWISLAFLQSYLQLTSDKLLVTFPDSYTFIHDLNHVMYFVLSCSDSFSEVRNAVLNCVNFLNFLNFLQSLGSVFFKLQFFLQFINHNVTSPVFTFLKLDEGGVEDLLLVFELV